MPAAPLGFLRHHPARALLLASVLATIVLAVNFARHVRQPIDDIDEAAVVFSTAYFDLLLEGRLLDPAWRGLDALDHPPAWKYAHGAALLLAGRPRGTIEKKEIWLDWAWDDDPKLQQFLNREVTLRDLVPGRSLSFVAVLAGLFWFGLLVSRAVSPLAGALALVFAGMHAAVKWASVHAMIDGLLFFGIIATSALTALWLERGAARGRVAPGAAMGLGAALGVLINTKITGVVGVAAAGLALVLLWRTLEPSVRRASAALGSFAVVIVTTAGVAIAINPSLWADPLGFFFAMVDHRARQLGLQMLLFDGRIYVPVGEGLRRLCSRAFLWPDPLYRAASVPLVAFGVTLGALAFFRVRGAVSPAKAALVAQLSCWALATAVTYRLDWPRYTLPLVPLLALLCAVGLIEVVRARGRPPLLHTVVATICAASIGVFARAPLPVSSSERHAALVWGLERAEKELPAARAEGHQRRALERAKAVIIKELATDHGRGGPSE